MLNISVPISQLQKTGEADLRSLLVIEQKQITRNITWSEVISTIARFPSELIFGFGSVEQPSVILGDDDSGFYAPQLSSVAVTTEKVRRLLFSPTGVVELGRPDENNIEEVRIGTEATVKCDAVIEDNIILKKDAFFYSDVILLGDINFNDITLDGEGDGGDLNVTSEYIEIGKNCDQDFKVHSVTRDYCNVEAKNNFTIVKNLENDKSVHQTTVTTKDLTVFDEATFYTLTSVESINGNNLIIFDKEGDLEVFHNFNAGVIFGDGKGITNLNIPNSLRFKGSIDPSSEPPKEPIEHGDLYYSNATGIINTDWVALAGEEVRIGQWIYYFATPETKWVLGAISDLQSPFFMFVDLDQTSEGEKTFNVRFNVENDVNVSGADILANTLGLSEKAISAQTVSGDASQTLTTKSYVDNRMVNAIFDFKLSTSKYIIGQAYDGAIAQTWDLDVGVTGTDNLVLRNLDGDFIANEIYANYLIGRSNDSKTQDVIFSALDNDQSNPITLVSGTGPSSTVYSDLDFTYNPTLSQLNVDNVIVNEVVGDITGNVTTFTEFKTPRSIWGNIFTAGSDITGTLSFVGNIYSDTTNTRDLGKSNDVWAKVYSTTFHGTLEGNVEVGDSLRQTLTDGEFITGEPWDGSTPRTWRPYSTNDNTPETIVERDSQSNFSSNIITANQFVGPLTGNVTGNITGSSGSVTGNAATASKMETARDIWSQLVDFSNPSTSGDLARTGHIVPLSDSTYDIGSDTLKYKTLRADKFIGDFPNNVTSSDKVNNPLGKGDYIEGIIPEWDGSTSDTWSVDPRSENIFNKTVLRDENGDFQAGTITASFIGPLTGDVTGDITGTSGSVTGNAATTTRLRSTRSLWGQPFDGRQDVRSFINSTGNIVPLTNNQYGIGREDKYFTDVYAETFHGYFQDNVEDVDHLVSFLKPGSYIQGDSWNGSSDVYWNIFARSTNTSSSVVLRDSQGGFSASTISAELSAFVTGNVTGDITGSSGFVTGNTATTTKLETQREIRVTLTGVLTGSGTFEYVGTNDVSVDVETELSVIDIANLDRLPE